MEPRWYPIITLALVLCAAIAALAFGEKEVATLLAGTAVGQLLPQPMRKSE